MESMLIVQKVAGGYVDPPARMYAGPDLKVSQMVTYVLLWRQDFSCRHDASYPYLVKFGNC